MVFEDIRKCAIMEATALYQMNPDDERIDALIYIAVKAALVDAAKELEFIGK